jgi:iron complex outermembrane recepter protein
MFHQYAKQGLFLIFLLTGITNIFSQQVTQIQGMVYDDNSGVGLAGANIRLEEMNQGISSADSGKFSFSDIPNGRYTISVGYIGYKLKKISVLVKNTEKMFIPINLVPYILDGQTVEVTGTRAIEGETPVAFTNISNKELEETYTASDVPMILNEVPGVYAYSLTGDNLGYSFLKIRGFDQRRIGVMINDIPLNDPEDQEVYWVDLPDLAESVQDIQIQRGVGSTIYGTSTFGGSVNIKTSNYAAERSSQITLGGGSFNTRKALLEYNSGLVNNSYSFYGRFSKITSDGYRRNSSSDLQSFFLGFERYDKDIVTKLNIFSGEEVTHPDWDGIPESILQNDRRYKLETYKNAVDNFTQSHFQLINEWTINSRMSWHNSFFYVRGEGFYENQKTGKKLTDFGMNYFETTDPGFFGADSLNYYLSDNDTLVVSAENKYTLRRTDLVRQKWVKKNQYGWITKFTFDAGDGFATLGSSMYLFDSHHFGKVLWAKHIPSQYSADRKYYDYNGDRYAIALYFNYLYDVFEDAKLMTNLLYEHKSSEFQQSETALYTNDLLNRYTVSYNFVSPRIGLNYSISPQISVYGNLSFAQREPADNELWDNFTGPDDLGVQPLFEDSKTVTKNGQIQYIEWSNSMIDPESVFDYEAGVNYNAGNIKSSLNLYYMDFRNEIVPLGSLHNDGSPVKGNAEQTVHMGAEFDLHYKPVNYFQFSGNFSYSNNYFKEFIQNTYDGGTEDLGGNKISGFPELMGNLRVTNYWNNLTSSISLRYVGKQYLDNTENEERTIDAFNLANFAIDYRLKDFIYFPEVRFMFTVNNVFDTSYEAAGYYYFENFYYPGAVRNYYFGLTLNF